MKTFLKLLTSELAIFLTIFQENFRIFLKLLSEFKNKSNPSMKFDFVTSKASSCQISALQLSRRN
jgi:hypothetical protein